MNEMEKENGNNIDNKNNDEVFTIEDNDLIVESENKI